MARTKHHARKATHVKAIRKRLAAKAPQLDRPFKKPRRKRKNKNKNKQQNESKKQKIEAELEEKTDAMKDNDQIEMKNEFQQDEKNKQAEVLEEDTPGSSKN